jgi:hypothetical protein
MAFSRYQNTAAIRYESKGKFHLQTPVFVPGEVLAQNIPFRVVEYTEGTRLDVLAKNFLGDGRYWWAICMFNDLSSPYDPKLTVGSLIRVPNDITDVINYIKKV